MAVTPQPPAAARPSGTEHLLWARVAELTRQAPSTLVFSLVLFTGVVIRLLCLGSDFGLQNSDTSVVFLEARHVMHGDLSVFYWGQNYGGTLIQLTAGELFRLTGPSFAALEVVEIVYWLAACLLLRSIVARACGVVAGDVAGALFWLASPYMVILSFADPGFYGSGLVVCLGALWVAQRAGTPPDWRSAAAVGCFLGLAFWTTPMAVAVAGPAAVWVALRLRSLRPAVVGAAACLLGAAPWLWANLHTNFASLSPLGPQGSPVARYAGAFTQVVPGLFGFVPASFSGRAIAALFLVLPLVGAIAALRTRNVAAGLLCVSGLLVPAVVALGGTAVVPAAFRYGAFMLPGVVVVIGWAVSTRPALGCLAVVLVAGCTGHRIWDQTEGLRRVPDASTGTPTILLAQYLEARGVSAIWADYWESYLLTAATQERITAAALGVRRQASYEQAAMRPSDTTVVVFAGGPNDRALMAERGLPRSRRMLVAGQFAVWTFDGRVNVPQFLTAV